MTPSVLVRRSRSDASLVELMGDGETHTLTREDLPEAVRERERVHPRWVWDSTAHWYPELVEVGVRVSRCLDLRLSRAILRLSAPRIAAESVAPPDVAGASLGGEEVAAAPRRHDAAWEGWDGGWGARGHDSAEPGLFEMDRPEHSAPEAGRDAQAQWLAQEQALREIAAYSPDRARALQLLIAAESAGALAAVELHHDGLPLREDLHRARLQELLGERGRFGARPARLEELAARIRLALNDPHLNPDSQPHLLRALRRMGLDVNSTARWELRGLDHPVLEDLLEYKKLARLASANGWAWLDSWVSGGRFRADYVPAGVVTGRWSSRGGGALSLPKVIRSAVVADPGWTFVVADAAQLEPRVLAAISGDEAMLAAGARGDLYQALVADGVVEDREHAKVAMLGALYG
ncbi:DNA polymerase-1 [Serinibacter salmoneus]|uniref:DNA-directed DNA polymerase n=1 Tax=Serinibacter salmoneus TaxID=556530 RepID=A0A2A9D1B1_9MICO|nr:DNA polymerase-1 [Serinibacter salmoneus]